MSIWVKIETPTLLSKFLESMSKNNQISEIEMDRIGKYKLKKPITFEVFYDEGVWTIENKKYNIVGCGYTIEEALKEVEEDFEVLVEEIVNEDDANLHELALMVKKELKGIIEEG